MPDPQKIYNFILEDQFRDFLALPVADALIPINPKRLVPYVAGSILSQDLGVAKDLVGRPFDNLIVAGNFIQNGHNATHVAKRAGIVLKDTININFMAEGGGLYGATAAGAHANQCTDLYRRSIIDDFKLLDSVKQMAT